MDYLPPDSSFCNFLLPSGYSLLDLSSDIAYGSRKDLLRYLFYPIVLPIRQDLIFSYSSKHVIDHAFA